MTVGVKIQVGRPWTTVTCGGALVRITAMLFVAAFVAAAVTTGGVGALSLLNARTESTIRPVGTLSVPPLVSVIEVKSRKVNVVVRSEGIVTPRAESRLAAETTGRIVELSPNLTPGGFVREGEVLVRLDSRDHGLAVTAAEVELEQANLRLETEEQKAAVARKEWELVGQGEPSALALHLPQLASARATIKGAEAALEKARLELERTIVTAPFSGCVRDAQIGLGQYLQRGMPIASIYSVDAAHVRLPIPDPELAFVVLPFGPDTQTGPAVTLSADFAGEEHRLVGRIVRTEGEVDAKTGVVHAIVEFRDPYGVRERRGGAPFMSGTYVRAEIVGRAVEAIEIPATALRESSSVLVVDGNDRVDYREVEVIRAEDDRVLVRGGLEEGDRVCVSAPDPLVNGMRVRVQEPTAADPQGS